MISNFTRLPNLFSLCFAKFLVPKDIIHSRVPFVSFAGRLDLGEYFATSSSGSDLNASAMIISSMLSNRVVSLSDEFLNVGSRNSRRK